MSRAELEVFSVVEEFIKRREVFLKNLMEEKQLRAYFINSNLAIAIFSAVYGATMGVYAGGLQIIYDAIKILLLLLISVYITVPSYYVLSSLLGGKVTFSSDGCSSPFWSCSSVSGAPRIGSSEPLLYIHNRKCN